MKRRFFFVARMEIFNFVFLIAMSDKEQNPDLQKLDLDTLNALEDQIKGLKENLILMQKNGGALDEPELVEMAQVASDIEYRGAIVDRLYKRKGVMYSLGVKMPLKILNVGSLSDSQRFVRDSIRGVTSPICVICNGGILMHNPNQVPVNGQVKWFCSNSLCSFEVWAASASKDVLMLDVRKKIHTDISDLGRDRWSELSESEKQDLVVGHLSKASMLRWVSVFLFMLIIFEIVMQFWWALMMMLPVLCLAILLSLKWCYRAWQIKTGNVFMPNSMFMDWLKTAESYYSVDWVDSKNNEGEPDND